MHNAEIPHRKQAVLRLTKKRTGENYKNEAIYKNLKKRRHKNNCENNRNSTNYKNKDANKSQKANTQQIMKNKRRYNKS